MTLLVQQIVLGLLVGGVYVAVAVGFSLVWGILNIVNLAHGALVIAGAYLTWWLFATRHVDPFLSLPLVAAALFAFGYLLQRVLVNRIIRAPLFFTLLLTFGVNLVLVNVLLLLFKSDFRSVTPSYSGSGLAIGGVEVVRRDEDVPPVALEERAAAVRADGVRGEGADGVPDDPGDDRAPVGPRRAGQRLGKTTRDGEAGERKDQLARDGDRRALDGHRDDDADVPETTVQRVDEGQDELVDGLDQVSVS